MHHPQPPPATARPPARRRPGLPAAAAAALALLAVAPGCSRFDAGSYRVADALTNTGARLGAPWGRNRPDAPEAGLTIQRVRGDMELPNTLSPEAGDVWPGPLPPRATLANPEAALRGAPAYNPAGQRDPLTEPAAGPRTSQNLRGVPPALRGSADPPPMPMVPPPELQPGPAALAPLPPLPARPPARADGRVIQPPLGPPVVTSGGTDRVQSFNTPGAGGGVAVRDGNSTVLFGPDGRIQTVPNAPR